MAKPYDATTKCLIELRPAEWIDFLELPPGHVSLLDADLSTISTAADRLIHVAGSVSYILHNEFESGKDTAKVAFRLLQYNVNAEAKYQLPVVSTVFLLHRGADSPHLTGVLKRVGPNGQIYHTFEYKVVRIWQLDVEMLLTAGLSLLPFAPIANTSEGELPAIIRQMEKRIETEANDDQEAGDLWTATYVLMGLRYNKAFNNQLLQGVRRMKESVTYQAILEEGEEKGRLEGESRALVRMATKRFGVPSQEVLHHLQRITSVEHLEQLLDRVMEVETWDELLSTGSQS